MEEKELMEIFEKIYKEGFLTGIEYTPEVLYNQDSTVEELADKRAKQYCRQIKFEFWDGPDPKLVNEGENIDYGKEDRNT